MIRIVNIRSAVLVLMAHCCFSSATAAEPEKFLGLVEIPALFGNSDPNGPPGQKPPEKRRSILLRAEPNLKARVVAQVDDPGQVLSREHGYEESSVVVFGRKGKWYRIKAGRSGDRTATGEQILKSPLMGWIGPGDAGKFHSYEELVGGMAFVNRLWDGKLYAAPDLSGKFEKIVGKTEEMGAYSPEVMASADAKVLENRTVAGRLWFHIQMVEGRCEGEEEEGQKGWVPGYDDVGRPLLGYYSRGC